MSKVIIKSMKKFNQFTPADLMAIDNYCLHQLAFTSDKNPMDNPQREYLWGVIKICRSEMNRNLHGIFKVV